jgi:hypothetical protein
MSIRKRNVLLKRINIQVNPITNRVLHLKVIEGQNGGLILIIFIYGISYQPYNLFIAIKTSYIAVNYQENK